MKIRFLPLIVALFVATTARAQAPQPSSGVPQAGEIELSGTVSAIAQDNKSFVLQASSYSVPGTQTVFLKAPKPKTVTVDANTRWARVQAASPAEVSEFSDTAFPEFKIGRTVSVIGKDLGTGKSLPARLIKSRATSTRQAASPPAQRADSAAPASAAPASAPTASEQSSIAQAAAGWPQKIAGRITGTPTAADLDGDGEQEIVLPVWSTDGAAQLVAYQHDGSPVRNWPVVFFSAEQMKQRNGGRPFTAWYGSPSAMDLDRDGTDEIVMPLPDGEPRGVRILFGGGEPWPWTFNAPADPWISVPLVDLNNDRVVDLILGQVHTTVQNKPVPGWPETRMLHGYAPCVGDADGDGDLEFYQPDYQNHWHLPDQPPANTLSGYDHQGNALPGWPQKIAGIAMFPVMGDVWGDDKMEVCVTDSNGQIHLWTHDGKALPSTRRSGEYSSVFKAGGAFHGQPTLADLDGDGKAEIIMRNGSTGALHAWRGDGSSVTSEATGKTSPDGASRDAGSRDAGNTDGILAPLRRDGLGRHVTVADLGGDGEMDLFTGEYWVRWRPGSEAKVQQITPPGAESVSTIPIITDLNRDGLAEIVVGGQDGQLHVINTGKAHKPEWLQWVTIGGDFRHTGAWHPPTKRKP